MPGKDTKSAIPELGMAAAAFASLLVIATLDWPPEPLLRAARFFAVGIPVVIAGAFVSLLMRRADIKWVKTALWILRLICILIGDVGCAIGIYFIFRHVSSPAARDFLITALVCWLALGLLDMAVSRFGRQK